MNTTHLIHMANQILKNFAIHGEDAAVTATAEHIRDFWEPRMIDALLGVTDVAEPQLAKLVSLLKTDL